MTDIFQLLDRTATILGRNSDAERLGLFVTQVGDFRVKAALPNGRARSFYATVDVATRCGLIVPICCPVILENGKPSIEPEALANQILDAAQGVKVLAPKYEEAKVELENAVRDELAAIAQQHGIVMSLATIRVRQASPDQLVGAEPFLAFDVYMTMLSNRDLEVDTYGMWATDAEEFVSYIRTSLLPEQINLLARKRAGEPASEAA